MSAFASGALKKMDALLGPAACLALSRAQVAPEARTLSDFPPGAPVLVARPGGIGDAALLLPCLSALRAAFPRSPVDVLCESRNAPVFSASGMVRRVLRYDAAPVSVLRVLRRGGWAVFCDTEQFHHFSGVMGALARAPVRIGFAVNPARLGLYSRTVPYDSAGPESEQFARVFSSAAGRRLDLPPLRGILPAEKLPPPPPGLPPRFVAIHVGGSSPRKRWGADNWGKLAAAIRRDTGMPAVFVGGMADAPTGGLVGDAGGPPLDFCGKLPLAQTVSVLARASAMVGPDSGLAHLAVAVGTPVVVLFGPGDPAKWGPPPDAGVVLRAGLPCSPCSIYGTMKPCRRAWCMEGIAPDQVAEAVALAAGADAGAGAGAAGAEPTDGGAPSPSGRLCENSQPHQACR